MFLHALSVLCEQCVSAHSVSMVSWKCRKKQLSSRLFFSLRSENYLREDERLPVEAGNARVFTWKLAFWISFLIQLSVKNVFSVVSALFGKTIWLMSLQFSSSVPKKKVKSCLLFLVFQPFRVATIAFWQIQQGWRSVLFEITLEILSCNFDLCQKSLRFRLNPS